MMIVLLILVLILFVGGWIYLKQHKKQVISYIESEAKKGLNGGEIHIGDISVGFGHTFPRIAFTIDSLYNVTLGSVWLTNIKNAMSFTFLITSPNSQYSITFANFC